MDAVTTLFTVIHKIVEAAETAQENKISCKKLAVRARGVGEILRADRGRCSRRSTSAGGDGDTVRARRINLGRLKAVLEEALDLVKSCQRSGPLAWVEDLFMSESRAAKFQAIQAEITACVGDHGVGEQLAALRHDERRRANAQAAPAQGPQQQQRRYHVQLAQHSPEPSPLRLFVEQSAQPPGWQPPTPSMVARRSAVQPPPQQQQRYSSTQSSPTAFERALQNAHPQHRAARRRAAA